MQRQAAIALSNTKAGKITVTSSSVTNMLTLTAVARYFPRMPDTSTKAEPCVFLAPMERPLACGLHDSPATATTEST